MVEVSKSFFEAMAVLASGGKVRNKNWSKDALYVEVFPYLNFPVAVFNKKVAEINGQSVIEQIGWSPSLADFIGEWEILEQPSEHIENTFGYTVSKLFEYDESDLMYVKHKNWSGNKKLILETEEGTMIQEFEDPAIQETTACYLYLVNEDKGEQYPYLPTIPDILRKGWILEKDEI